MLSDFFHAGGETCLMTFDELCKKNLGAADYIALAHAFHTVAVLGIPIFVSSHKPEAYRFVTLIDVFYENRIQVMCSAAGNPMDIFQNVFSQEEARKQVLFLMLPASALMSMLALPLLAPPDLFSVSLHTGPVHKTLMCFHSKYLKLCVIFSSWLTLSYVPPMAVCRQLLCRG